MQEKNSISSQQLEVVETNDGSTTIYHPEIGEHYHSHHGALQEAKHVFLNSGLEHFLSKIKNEQGAIPPNVSILEVGFGTGLNYLLTADYCYKNNIKLDYTSLERFPLPSEMIRKTGYAQFVDAEIASSFYNTYEKEVHSEQAKTYTFEISKHNALELVIGDALNFQTKKTFDVLYFDAFSAIHQPEMWTQELLEPICGFLKPGGVFITYAITGNLKRLMKSLGFEIEKVPGAPGKREMLRAVRLQ